MVLVTSKTGAASHSYNRRVSLCRPLTSQSCGQVQFDSVLAHVGTGGAARMYCYRSLHRVPLDAFMAESMEALFCGTCLREHVHADGALHLPVIEL